ncbi:MAG: HAD family phosphatase [Clostridiales bacterium]|nr:HAD family phosphatase [Clostridiales bacterium]
MYKLISLDLDGTLLDNESKISERNLEAVLSCYKNDVQVVVATGRSPRFTFGFIPELLTGNYCVCYNGAQIFRFGKLVYEQAMDTKTLNAILAETEVHEHVVLEGRKSVYSNFPMTTFLEDVKYAPITGLHGDDVYKLLVINPSKNLYDRLNKKYSTHCYIIETGGGNLIEIMDKSVSKLNAIMWVAKEEHIDSRYVMAFGDDLNDLEIINGVGMGVAMGNGHIQLKAIADIVTLSNEDDGVAVVLEKMIEDFYE